MERLLELALAMLDDARREQNTIQLTANNWLTNNFTLEGIVMSGRRPLIKGYFGVALVASAVMSSAFGAEN